MRALLIASVFFVGFVGAVTVFFALLSPFLEEASRTADQATLPQVADTAAAIEQARTDMQALAAMIESHRAATGGLPADAEEVLSLWSEARPDEPQPTDPFDGFPYGYRVLGETFILYSSGPDGIPETGDDVVYESGADSVDP